MLTVYISTTGLWKSLGIETKTISRCYIGQLVCVLTSFLSASGQQFLKDHILRNGWVSIIFDKFNVIVLVKPDLKYPSIIKHTAFTLIFYFSGVFLNVIL